MIISHMHKDYRKLNSQNKYNGAYYYSQEIVKNIIPKVQTDYNWVTINCNAAADHSIVFVHNNLHPEHYDYLRQYHDLILVVGAPQTASKVAHLGKTIYLPLSVDIANVAQYKCPKDRDVCCVGRANKFDGTKAMGDFISGVPREQLLARLAHYKRAYAVGRCAIEAKVLGCEVLPYDPRYPDPSLWTIVDNAEAAAILQHELDAIQ